MDWAGIKAVIFDLDGTLYDERRMRFAMALEMLAAIARRPACIAEVRIVATLRQVRERLAEAENDDFAERQFTETAARTGAKAATVQRVYAEWLLDRPLKHIRRCAYTGVHGFIDLLRRRGLATAVLSDYPADAKLAALGLDFPIVVSAGVGGVTRMKPNPAGLLTVVERTGRSVAECVMIGDRDERDGTCAKRVGMKYLRKQHWPKPGGFTSYTRLHEEIRRAIVGA